MLLQCGSAFQLMQYTEVLSSHQNICITLGHWTKILAVGRFSPENTAPSPSLFGNTKTYSWQNAMYLNQRTNMLQLTARILKWYLIRQLFCHWILLLLFFSQDYFLEVVSCIRGYTVKWIYDASFVSHNHTEQPLLNVFILHKSSHTYAPWSQHVSRIDAAVHQQIASSCDSGALLWTNFTKGYWDHNWNIFALIVFLMVQSGRKLKHVTTARWSWHVHIYDLIGLLSQHVFFLQYWDEELMNPL